MSEEETTVYFDYKTGKSRIGKQTFGANEMSNLPEWIESEMPWDTSADSSKEIFRLRKALAIAWEALEQIKDPGCQYCDVPQNCEHNLAKDAMRRIEELGK